MKMKMRHLFLMCILGAMFAEGSTNEVMQNTEQDMTPKLLDMYLNMSEKCIRLGEKAPLLVLTVVNKGNEAVYIHDLEDFSVSINSINGDIIPRLFVDPPPMTMSSNYTNVLGKSVYMQEVVEILPQSGVVFLCQDFVKPRSNWLKSGSYYLYFNEDWLLGFVNSQVITRADRAHTFWVLETEIPIEIAVSPNTVSFEVVEGEVAGTGKEAEKVEVP